MKQLCKKCGGKLHITDYMGRPHIKDYVLYCDHCGPQTGQRHADKAIFDQIVEMFGPALKNLADK